MERDDIIDDVKEALIRASYHYADDTTSEWALGRKYVEAAAKIVINNNMTDDEMEKAFKLAKPLVTFNHLKNMCISLQNTMEK